MASSARSTCSGPFLSAHDLQAELRAALDPVAFPADCALLDWLDYPNVGDHLIWAGSLQYLSRTRGVNLHYAASPTSFDPSFILSLPAEAGLVFNGGGNLGDLWALHQKFRERVIAQFHDRPIVILSQTIHFEDPANLREAARVFNAHPDLTVVARGQTSYEIAARHFSKCRVILAPDMAFELAGDLHLPHPPLVERRPLYHYRADKEQTSGLSPRALGLRSFHVKDWAACRRTWHGLFWQTAPPFRSAKILAAYLREAVSEPFTRVRERNSLRTWDATRFPGDAEWQPAQLQSKDGSGLHRESWRLVHSGVFQMSRRRLVITSRLHGHILCVLLGIPHVFLPGGYHKNESFYRTWSTNIPFCRFVDSPDPKKIEAACRELESFS